MNKIILIIVFTILCNGTYSQEIARTDSLPLSQSTLDSEKAEIEWILKNISSRVSHIEMVHKKIIRFNDDFTKEIKLVHETLPQTEDDKSKKLITKRVTFLRFEGEALKEVEIDFKQSYLNISWEFENKKLVYNVSDYMKTIIYTHGTAQDYVTDLEYFSLANRVKILRKIETNLIESAYKVENLLHRYETKKSKKEKKQMELY